MNKLRIFSLIQINIFKIDPRLIKISNKDYRQEFAGVHFKYCKFQFVFINEFIEEFKENALNFFIKVIFPFVIFYNQICLSITISFNEKNLAIRLSIS